MNTHKKVVRAANWKIKNGKESEKPKVRRLQWFVDRIGERIFRDHNGCNCISCDQVLKNGLEVINMEHADYLRETQNELANEGIFCNYRDKK